MNLIQVWIHAARPATLLCAFVPVCIGGAIAHVHQGFNLKPWAAALLGALLIQIGTNFANDMYDYLKGADDEHRVGPMRTVQAGHISVGAMKSAMFLTFAAAVFVGSYLVWHAGWPIIAIGVVSLASGFAYTGGPYPLGYNGLGDLFVFIFFGFVAVCGTVFVQLLDVPSMTHLASIPIGAISTAIIVVNNIRDVDTDRLVGKRTLAVRFGRRFAQLEYLALISIAYLIPFVIWRTNSASIWILLPCFSLPLALRLCQVIWTSHDADKLNIALKQTALLLLAYGFPFALGIIWSLS